MAASCQNQKRTLPPPLETKIALKILKKWCLIRELLVRDDVLFWHVNVMLGVMYLAPKRGRHMTLGNFLSLNEFSRALLGYICGGTTGPRAFSRLQQIWLLQTCVALANHVAYQRIIFRSRCIEYNTHLVHVAHPKSENIARVPAHPSMTEPDLCRNRSMVRTHILWT